MPAAEIRIEGKPVYFLGDTGRDHLYLVLVAEDGTELVLRAGPEGGLGTGALVFEIEVPMAGSADGRLPEDRALYGSRVLDLGGRAVADVWGLMVEQAQHLDAARLPYRLFAENSNSAIGALLHVVGIGVQDVLPDQPGRVDNYPGLGSILDGVGFVLTGGAAADVILGGRSGDDLAGGGGADALSGMAGADTLAGGAGDDFLNGGWGPDRLAGGEGADRFYHAGVAGHGSDWITDFAADDRLVLGRAVAPADLALRLARTPGAGDDAVAEVFVVHRPSGQILWALTDGAALAEIGLRTPAGLVTLPVPAAGQTPAAARSVAELVSAVDAVPEQNSIPENTWHIVREETQMATITLNSQFFNLISAVINAEDPTTLLIGRPLDELIDLGGIAGQLEGSWTAVTLTDTQIVLTQGTATATVTGTGLGPLDSADAFFAAVMSGSATGSPSSIVLSDSGTEVLRLAMAAGGLTVTAGSMSLEIDGTLPTDFSGIPVLMQLVSLLDGGLPEDLPPEDRADLIAMLTPFAVTGITLSDGADALLSLAIGADSITLSTPVLSVEIDAGALPANLGELLELIFVLDDAGGGLGGAFLLLDAIDFLGAQISTADGTELAAISGDLSSESLTMLLDGAQLPDGVALVLDTDGLNVNLTATDEASLVIGTIGNDTLAGGAANDTLLGLDGNDKLFGMDGSDVLRGGDGNDTLNGGTGDDFLYGGATSADLRDVIYGGDGNDWADGGWGNDELNGGVGNDTLNGDFGADTLIGNDGNDLLSGAAGADVMFGNAGNDTLNGGFGYDRMNGGTGADSFFHLGVAAHGSDWVQDYTAADGDVLSVGIAGATASQFQVNFASTPGAGAAGVAEAFVIYKPTGQILWALVDGAGQAEINLMIAGSSFDLLA